LDYTDERLYRSGLFKDAIESHFWLLENCGKSLDSVFVEMKVSIDSMMTKLVKNEKKLNEVTDYLFDLLERHSLFQASEYLALKVLNEVSCTINNDLAKQLETYRAMKKGNIAPDLTFPENTIYPIDLQKQKLRKLSDLKTPFTLVLFGASSCPKCAEEIPQIAALYSKWKAKGVEVVFISLDETGNDFYIIVSSLTDANIGVKTKFFNEITILIDVVTTFNTKMYSNSDPQPKMKEVADVITGKILNLVKPTRDTTGIADDSDFQVVDVKKESSQHFPVLDTDTKKIIRRLTRFSQIVIEK
jgi:thiol-disulfide isomerase/thioredoxin